MAGQSAAQKALYTERRMRALRASVSGRTYEEIVILSQKEGWLPDPYHSRQTVSKDIQKALKERQAERNAAADVYIQQKLEEIEVMKAAAWKVLRARHYVVNQGVIVYVGVSAEEGKKRGWHSVDALRQDLIKNADGSFKEPLEDDKPVLDAIDRIMRLQDQELKITGGYAPVKKQVEVNNAADGVAASIERIVANLASGGPGSLTPSTAARGRTPVVRHPRSIGAAHRTADGPDTGA